jgi:hypothetical protein
MAEVEGRKPATAGRKLVMDDARARPGSHTPLSAAAHAGSPDNEHVTCLRSKDKDVPEDTRSTVAGSVVTR